MNDNPEPAPIREIPPGSTVLRELAHAVEQSLALPKAATQREEVTYLRILRNRARLVQSVMRRITRDRMDEDRDVMLMVTLLRDQVSVLGDDNATHDPEATS
jgi:hypothetical protein